jgi:Ca-activated chloride channel family protein
MKQIFIAILLTISLTLAGQSYEKSPILFIYDASGSMWGQIDGKTKMNLASSVLTNVVNGLDVNQKIGLVAYGHRNKSDCEDVEFLVDIQNQEKSVIGQKLAGIKPLGKTPLAHSASLVVDYLKIEKSKATIILITDGIESCNGDLCKVIKNAKEAGIEFKLHIVGFGLKEGEKEALQCAAIAGGGKYFDAVDSKGLTAVLEKATSTTIDDPESNFKVFATKNKQPIDAYALIFEKGSESSIASMRTYRDTGDVFLSDGNYTMRVRALENTDLEPITVAFVVKDGMSVVQEVSFDAGTLRVTTTNNGSGWDAMVKVKDPISNKVIAQTRTYGRTKEMQVPPGAYNLTFEALTIKGELAKGQRNDLKVLGGELKEISYDFPSGIAMVGVKFGDELVDAAVNIKSMDSNAHVAGSRTYTSASSNPRKFILSPGNYSVTIQTLGAHKGHKQQFEMKIQAGITSEKIIQIK